MGETHEELLTVAQAADEANRRCGGGFSARTLWRHIYKGALPIVRRGPFRRPRIRRPDFEAYLVVGTHDTGAPGR